MPIDFPFYNGRPAAFTAGQWLLLVASVAAAIGVLGITLPLFPSGPASFLPGLLFAGIPLATLAMLAPRHWTAIFRRPRLRDLGWMVAFALLNIAITFAVGFVVQATLGAAPNPAVALLSEMGALDRVVFFLRTAPQLLGEEIFTLLPFLAVMHLAQARLHATRRTAIVAAWLLSAVWFAAAHLPTYDWNIVQCLAIIGSARLVLTLPFMLTKNIWVSTGAHILNDWLILGLAMLGPALQQGGAT